MKNDSFDWAVRFLRTQHKNRKRDALLGIVLGVVFAVGGGWGEFFAAPEIQGFVGQGESLTALDLLYSSTATRMGVISRLNLLAGIVLLGFSIVMLIRPDPKSTVLLTLVDRLDLEDPPELSGSLEE